MAAWCYMLLCRDSSFYVGCTTDIEGRIGQHQAGTQPGYTSTRRPVEVVWVEEFQNLDDAMACERRLKGWSRVKKAALICSDWGALSAAARSYQHHPR